MRTASGFFEIQDDEAFFTVVSNAHEAYRASNAKAPDQLLLLVLGLAHLREWIAPDYKKDTRPKNNAERFVAKLLETPDYQTVLLLANHAKHQRRKFLPSTQTTTFVEMIDDRDIPIDSWLDFDKGPASTHYYGDHDLVEVFAKVVSFYFDHWFSFPTDERWKGNDV